MQVIFFYFGFFDQVKYMQPGSLYTLQDPEWPQIIPTVLKCFFQENVKILKWITVNSNSIM